MSTRKLNIARKASATAKESGYICESMSRAKAMPTPPKYRPTASAANAPKWQNALAYAMTAAKVDSMATAAAFGMLKKLTANSGIKADGKRPVQKWNKRESEGYTDANSRLYELRGELCVYFGYNGVDPRPVTYWEKVSHAAEVLAAVEREAAEYAERLTTAKAAKAAAKRAGNMGAYAVLNANAAALAAALRKANANAAEARRGVDRLVKQDIGEGVELYAVAFAYYWEMLYGHKLTENSLCEGYASNGRRSVRPVRAWGYTLVRRRIRENAAARTQTAAGYEYFQTESGEAVEAHSEEYRRIVRTPKYYDNTPTLDEQTPPENSAKLTALVGALHLSKQQERILHLRLQGKSRAEIAAILKCREDSVTRQQKRIRAKARAYFPSDLLKKYDIE